MINKNEARRVIIATSTFPRHKNDVVPRFILDYAKAIKNIGIIPLVVAPHCKGLSLYDNIEGIDVYRFRYAPDFLEKLSYGAGIISNIKRNPFISLTIPFFIISQALKIRALVKKTKPSIVHAHWVLPQAISTSIATIGLNVDNILTMHGSDLDLVKKGIFRQIRRWLLRPFKYVTVVSSPMQAELEKLACVLPSRILVAPMGIPDIFFSQHSAPTKRNNNILCVGRLVKQKNPIHVLIAFHQAKAQLPTDTKLIFLGEGPEKTILQRYIDKYSLANFVELRGYRSHSQLAELYRTSKVIAHAADNEGLGLAILEAMASGLAPIVPDFPASKDYISNNINGFIYPKGNIEELSMLLIKVLSCDNTLHELSENARTTANLYSWSSCARRYASIYDTSSSKDRLNEY
ncbi:glycosyltransferase family 4 protein [Hahella sp. NBU794]|uniref:glycosyltransferase family 4 protein n=1 Tax=Hahella sp. NBU794 TaxID=3422590 RepID=UPI003D6F2B40